MIETSARRILQDCFDSNAKRTMAAMLEHLQPRVDAAPDAIRDILREQLRFWVQENLEGVVQVELVAVCWRSLAEAFYVLALVDAGQAQAAHARALALHRHTTRPPTECEKARAYCREHRHEHPGWSLNQWAAHIEKLDMVTVKNVRDCLKNLDRK